MSTQHETPAGSRDNVPRFLIWKKIQEKHWLWHYSKSSSPCFPQHTLWSFPSISEEYLKSITTAIFLPRKVSSTFQEQNYSKHTQRYIPTTQMHPSNRYPALTAWTA